MHLRLVAMVAVVSLFSGCERWRLERAIIGGWSSCSIDICGTTTFRSDHTVADRFDGFDSDSYSGTWRLDGRSIIIHVDKAAPEAADMIGKDLKWIIFDLKKDSMVAGYDEQHRLEMRRVK